MSIISPSDALIVGEIYEQNITAMEQIRNSKVAIEKLGLEKEITDEAEKRIKEWCLQQDINIKTTKEIGYDIPWYELEEKLATLAHQKEITETLKGICKSFADATNPEYTVESPTSKGAPPQGLLDIGDQGPALSVRALLFEVADASDGTKVSEK